MLSFVLPLQIPQLIEDAKRQARLKDKEIQIDLGFARASDWSMVKHGRPGRPFNFHLFEDLPTSLKPWAILLFETMAAKWREEIQLARPETFSDRDLWRDLSLKVDLLLAAVLPRRAVKADTLEDERRRA